MKFLTTLILCALSSTACGDIVSTNLIFHLDANDVDGDGNADMSFGAVSTWVDKSSTGLNISQGTAGFQPNQVAGILNGLPVVRFDGMDDYLFSATGLGLTGNPAVTVFIVATNTVSSANDLRLLTFGADGTGGATGGQVYGFNPDSSWRFNNGNRVFVNDNIDDGGDHIGVWTSGVGDTYGQKEFYLDGIVGTQTSANSAGSSATLIDETLAVGGSWAGTFTVNSPDKFVDTDIAEILIYDRELTLEEINQTGFFLEQKWGIDTAYVPIPEPSSVILSILGFMGLAGYSKRKMLHPIRNS